MREDHVGPLVCVHQVARNVRRTNGCAAPARSRQHSSSFFWLSISLPHPCGACGYSDVMRVPGNRMPFAAASNPLGTEPPTIRTSVDAGGKRAFARLQLQNHPPETYSGGSDLGIAVETTLSTFSPLRDPATSVR